MRRRWHSLGIPTVGTLDYKQHSLSGTPNTGNLDYKWHSLGLVHTRAPKHRAAVYGASRLGCLRLHNKIYGQDDWLRWWRTPEEGAHAKKVDYGRSKHYGQAALWNRNVRSWELTTIRDSLPLLLTIIKYIYFILSKVLTF